MGAEAIAAASLLAATLLAGLTVLLVDAARNLRPRMVCAAGGDRARTCTSANECTSASNVVELALAAGTGRSVGDRDGDSDTRAAGMATGVNGDATNGDCVSTVG